MVERHDIDALLIGSLYGELSSADEVRLQAHLESHPADRTVLADLTRAREVVRESRILQFQVDPPQSITSVLLQEAARRAPKKQRDRENEGWFQRFMRSFMAHPAMAAAAMLVVVVGVAGTMYMRNGAQFAEQTKHSAPVSTLESRDEAPASAPVAATPPMADPGPGNDQQQAAQGSAYGVTLSDDFRKGNAAAKEAELAKVGAAETTTEPKPEGKLTVKSAPAKPRVDTQTKPAPKTMAPGRHIVVTTPDRAPKDFDETVRREDAAKKTKSPAKLDIASDTGVAGDDLGRGNTGAGGIAMPQEARPAPATPPAPPPPSRPVIQSAPEPAPAPTTATTAPSADRNADRSAPERARLVEKPADRPSTGRAPAPSANEKQKTEADKAQAELNAWRNQHAQISARVRAGKCRDAAGLAVDLSNRAPTYYQDNVASDRDLQKCKQYIDAEREKDVELRAQRERASRARNTESTQKRAAPAPTADTKAESVK